MTNGERERERERESKDGRVGRGVPIGNLTSQLFANIYMNEFDQFVKHRLRVRNYVRYTDDFILISESRQYLKDCLSPITEFLDQKLALTLHPKKIIICKFHQGIDFLGYVTFPKYRLLRAKTRQRIFKKMRRRIKEYNFGNISENSLNQSLQSYLGVFSHANSYKLSEKLKNEFWFES